MFALFVRAAAAITCGFGLVTLTLGLTYDDERRLDDERGAFRLCRHAPRLCAGSRGAARRPRGVPDRGRSRSPARSRSPSSTRASIRRW